MAKQIYRLDPNRTLFLLCDIQEKFRKVMPHFCEFILNTRKLLNAGKVLKIHLIATEQYPEKLGKTVKELDISHALNVFHKTRFSMMSEELCQAMTNCYSEKPNIVLFGLETHVCVEQTALDFVSSGFNVFLPADCCVSRTFPDREFALKRMRDIGCIICTSEQIIFELMKDKNHPAFNDIRKLVAEPSYDVGLLPAKVTETE